MTKLEEKRLEVIREWCVEARTVPGEAICGGDADLLLEDMQFLLDRIQQLETELQSWKDN